MTTLIHSIIRCFTRTHLAYDQYIFLYIYFTITITIANSLPAQTSFTICIILNDYSYTCTLLIVLRAPIYLLTTIYIFLFIYLFFLFIFPLSLFNNDNICSGNFCILPIQWLAQLPNPTTTFRSQILPNNTALYLASKYISLTCPSPKK